MALFALGNIQSAGILAEIALCNRRNDNDEDEVCWILQDFDNDESCR